MSYLSLAPTVCKDLLIAFTCASAALGLAIIDSNGKHRTHLQIASPATQWASIQEKNSRLLCKDSSGTQTVFTPKSEEEMSGKAPAIKNGDCRFEILYQL